MTYMPPLPDPINLPEDALRRWLRSQTFSFQKIITGALQSGQELSSDNFVSGTSGWQIDGDGNAEFNGIVIRGDLISSNWNGTDPPDLSSVDSGATAGFALDSSEGAAQFEGGIFLGGSLSVQTGGDITVAGTSGQKTVIGYIGGLGGVQFHGATGEDEYGYIYAINSEELQIAAPIGDSSTYNGAILRLFSTNALGFQSGFQFGEGGVSNDTWLTLNDDGMRGDDGTAAKPFYSFSNDTDTGIFRPGDNRLAMVANGKRGIELANAGDIWFYNTSGELSGFWDDSVPAWRFFVGGNTSGKENLRLRAGGSASSLYLLDGLTDVGNHETLRLNRGTGTSIQLVGYYSSWLDTKTDIKGLDNPRNPWWKREWFMDLDPISSRKKKVGHFKGQEDMRTLSFYMENLIEHTNLLTTKGIRVGDAPDEHAILAVTVDYVQHLEERVRALEERVAT